jgi:hypothetical protein
MDYAPLYFGVFGGLYSIEVMLIEHYLLVLQRSHWYWWFLLGTNIIATTLPVSIYMLLYYWRHGELGIRPHKKGGEGDGPVTGPSRRCSREFSLQKVEANSEVNG